jgi:hypothetical protein
MAIDRVIKTVVIPCGTVTTTTANTTVERDITVAAGILAVGDMIVGINKPTHQAGLGIVGARVKDAVTLSVTYGNFTASTIVPTSEDYLVFVARPMLAA